MSGWLLAGWLLAALGWGLFLVAQAGNSDLAARYRARGVTIARQRESIRTLRHIARGSNVVPLRDSASAGRIADLLARNEAARADWSEVEGWDR